MCIFNNETVDSPGIRNQKVAYFLLSTTNNSFSSPFKIKEYSIHMYNCNVCIDINIIFYLNTTQRSFVSYVQLDIVICRPVADVALSIKPRRIQAIACYIAMYLHW
jgi:hypothetical protein